MNTTRGGNNKLHGAHGTQPRACPGAPFRTVALAARAATAASHRLVKDPARRSGKSRADAKLIDAVAVRAAAGGSPRRCRVPIGASALGPARVDTQERRLRGCPACL
jgi:hypothetical protein